MNRDGSTRRGGTVRPALSSRPDVSFVGTVEIISTGVYAVIKRWRDAGLVGDSTPEHGRRLSWTTARYRGDGPRERQSFNAARTKPSDVNMIREADWVHSGMCLDLRHHARRRSILEQTTMLESPTSSTRTCGRRRVQSRFPARLHSALFRMSIICWDQG